MLVRKCSVFHQATHSQKALLFSFDLSPYNIYKATNPPFLKQTDFLGDIRWHSTEHPWLTHRMASTCQEITAGSTSCRVSNVATKNPHQTTTLGISKTLLQIPPPEIPSLIFVQRTSGSKGGANGVIVLHRFQWCCFCLHPGPVGWFWWRSPPTHEGSDAWKPGPLSFGLLQCLLQQLQVGGILAGFKVLVTNSTNGASFGFTSHLPAVRFRIFLSKKDTCFATISGWTCHLLSPQVKCLESSFTTSYIDLRHGAAQPFHFTVKMLVCDEALLLHKSLAQGEAKGLRVDYQSHKTMKTFEVKQTSTHAIGDNLEKL